MKLILSPDGAEGGAGGTGAGEGAGGEGQAAQGGVFGSEGQAAEGGDPNAGGAAGTEGGAPASGAGTMPPAQTSITAEDIAKAIKATGIGQPAATPQAPRQYTQEEFDKAFNVWNPDENVVKAILAGGPDALKAVAAMRDGISKQAVTMASYLVSQLKEEMSGQISPIQSYYQEQQVKQLFNEFYEANKDLKPYDAIVRAVVDQMKASGSKFDSKTDAFKELANRVKTTMKSIPGLNGTPAASGTDTTGQPGKMPPLSGGGQGGSRGPQGTKPKSAGHAIFG